ncbi:MAG: hypothetical protein B6U95_04180 [Thermofilum sp. ex4484_82]|nr:hypothetical protein [Thermoproteales archaeon]OYT28385.1 MAG: hypothetical protein B6U95_04180 [Thermofilum sp. ex4484_82]OYT38548.1 MAG: hypothetical protein B6U96_04175 [Archaeoglobales archaeon ex4484_92]RLE76479.1 MAG: hypothetical protein DRZ80_00940 [Thermoprotei archaeon]
MKKKLTLTIDASIIEAAKKTAKKRNIPLSRLVENYLSFIAKPYVYCFSCGVKFYVDSAEVCPKCGWLICPECKACRCSLDENAAVSIFYMRRVYEDLLAGRLK